MVRWMGWEWCGGGMPGCLTGCTCASRVCRSCANAQERTNRTASSVFVRWLCAKNTTSLCVQNDVWRWVLIKLCDDMFKYHLLFVSCLGKTSEKSKCAQNTITKTTINCYNSLLVVIAWLASLTVLAKSHKTDATQSVQPACAVLYVLTCYHTCIAIVVVVFLCKTFQPLVKQFTSAIWSQ